MSRPPQIPRGDADRVCPLHRKSCESVCHRCPLWVQVRGRNPNTGDDVDRWDCSLALLPMLLIEGAQQTRAAGAAIESFRNEMVRANGTALGRVAAGLAELSAAATRAGSHDVPAIASEVGA